MLLVPDLEGGSECLVWEILWWLLRSFRSREGMADSKCSGKRARGCEPLVQVKGAVSEGMVSIKTIK